jgi:hypothetical protein
LPLHKENATLDDVDIGCFATLAEESLALCQGAAAAFAAVTDVAEEQRCARFVCEPFKGDQVFETEASGWTRLDQPTLFELHKYTGQNIETKLQLVCNYSALPGGVDDVCISTFALVNLRQGDQKGCHALNRIAATKFDQGIFAQLEFSFKSLLQLCLCFGIACDK